MMTVEVANNIGHVQALWRDYWKELGLPNDFQGFQEELTTLPKGYGAPRGALGLAYVGGVPTGTIALRPLEGSSCEVKRLYVRPRFRRLGIGRALLEWILVQARGLGYETAYGDTLPSMIHALRMYEQLGFRLMDHPYSKNPTPGALYLELHL